MNKYPPIIKAVPHMLYGGDYNPEQWRATRDIDVICADAWRWQQNGGRYAR